MSCLFTNDQCFVHNCLLLSWSFCGFCNVLCKDSFCASFMHKYTMSQLESNTVHWCPFKLNSFVLDQPVSSLRIGDFLIAICKIHETRKNRKVGVWQGPPWCHPHWGGCGFKSDEMLFQLTTPSNFLLVWETLELIVELINTPHCIRSSWKCYMNSEHTEG